MDVDFTSSITNASLGKLSVQTTDNLPVISVQSIVQSTVRFCHVCNILDPLLTPVVPSEQSSVLFPLQPEFPRGSFEYLLIIRYKPART
jgi:hypothetical protein